MRLKLQKFLEKKNIVVKGCARACCLPENKVQGQLSTKKIVKLLAGCEKYGYVGE